jgi:competence protein ComEC
MKREMGLLGVFIFIIVRFYFHFTSPKPYVDGDRIRITHWLTTEPARYEREQYFRLMGLKVYLPLYPEISYGDKIVIEGVVNGDKLKSAKLIKVEEPENPLYRFRNKLLTFYNTSIPAPHSGLISGMVIGSKSGLTESFWEKLKNSGTVHVVVASGMNITLVSGFLVNIFTIFFRRKLALVLAFAGIWTYALIAGFGAPIIRAAIMGSITFLSQESGRINIAVRSLIISGIVMLSVFPGWIVDIGFLLSFFATLSLILFQKRIQKFFKLVPSIIREDLSTTTAAQIGVFPILLFAFGQFNILSPFINALVLWTVPLITILGMVGGVAGLIIPGMGQVILFLAYPLTSWFIFVVNLAG